jgi:hypothetical protein
VGNRNRRLCTKCVKLRPTESFHNSPHCDVCRRPYFRSYNRNRYRSAQARTAELKRGREKYWRLVRKQRMERKAKLIALCGGKCCRCGYKRSAAALDFHHRKRKVRTLSHLLAINQPWAFAQAIKEASKCDLVCANCHREETYPGHDLQERKT